MLQPGLVTRTQLRHRKQDLTAGARRILFDRIGIGIDMTAGHVRAAVRRADGIGDGRVGRGRVGRPCPVCYYSGRWPVSPGCGRP